MDASCRYGDSTDVPRYSSVRNSNTLAPPLRPEQLWFLWVAPHHNPSPDLVKVGSDPLRYNPFRSRPRRAMGASYRPRALLPFDGFHTTSATVAMLYTFDLSRVPTQLCSPANRTGVAGIVILTVDAFAFGSRAVRRRTPIVSVTV